MVEKMKRAARAYTNWTPVKVLDAELLAALERVDDHNASLIRGLKRKISDLEAQMKLLLERAEGRA